MGKINISMRFLINVSLVISVSCLDSGHNEDINEIVYKKLNSKKAQELNQFITNQKKKGNEFSITLMDLNKNYKLSKLKNLNCNYDCTWYFLVDTCDNLHILKAPSPRFIKTKKTNEISIFDCINLNVFNNYSEIINISSKDYLIKEILNFITNDQKEHYKIFKTLNELNEFYKEEQSKIPKNLGIKSFYLDSLNFNKKDNYFLWIHGQGYYNLKIDFNEQNIENLRIDVLGSYTLEKL